MKTTFAPLRHGAYNLATGEMLLSSSPLGLRLSVERANRWNFGGCRPCWIFAHGASAKERLEQKVIAALRKKGVRV